MQPLSADTPKPLVQVAGKALIDHCLDGLAEAGVELAVVNVHHLAEKLRGSSFASQGSEDRHLRRKGRAAGDRRRHRQGAAAPRRRSLPAAQFRFVLAGGRAAESRLAVGRLGRYPHGRAASPRLDRALRRLFRARRLLPRQGWPSHPPGRAHGRSVRLFRRGHPASAPLRRGSRRAPSRSISFSTGRSRREGCSASAWTGCGSTSKIRQRSHWPSRPSRRAPPEARCAPPTSSPSRPALRSSTRWSADCSTAGWSRAFAARPVRARRPHALSADAARRPRHPRAFPCPARPAGAAAENPHARRHRRGRGADDLDALELPAAVPAMERQLVLTKLVLSWSGALVRAAAELPDEELVVPASPADAARLAASPWQPHRPGRHRSRSLGGALHASAGRPGPLLADHAGDSCGSRRNSGRRISPSRG